MTAFQATFTSSGSFNASFSDVSDFAVEFQSVINPSNVWNWMGKDAECIDPNLFSLNVALEDTGFATWTPSTTPATIIPPTTLDAITIDASTYNYYVRFQTDIKMAYAPATVLKSLIVRQVNEDWQCTGRRPTSVADIESSTLRTNTSQTISFNGNTLYYNSSGGQILSLGSTSFGIYKSLTSLSFRGSNPDAPSLTITTPTINARCSDSYLSVANVANVDQHNSTVKIKGELWRVKRSGMLETLWANAVDMWNNPIA